MKVDELVVHQIIMQLLRPLQKLFPLVNHMGVFVSKCKFL